MIFDKETIKDISILTDLRIAYLQEDLGAISAKDILKTALLFKQFKSFFL